MTLPEFTELVSAVLRNEKTLQQDRNVSIFLDKCIEEMKRRKEADVPRRGAEAG